VSADPVLDKYMPKEPDDFDNAHDYYYHLEHETIDYLPGHGGIYNAINLNLYQYASNNPTKYIDPDGKSSILHIIHSMLGNPVKPIDHRSAYVSSGYYRSDPHMRPQRHGALDIGGKGKIPRGYDVRSIFSGKVVHKGWRRGYGNTVTIQIMDGVLRGKKVLYAHLNKPVNLRLNQNVEKGQKVGEFGKTGGNYPLHSHVEIRDEHDNKMNINDLGRLLYRRTNVRDTPAR